MASTRRSRRVSVALLAALSPTLVAGSGQAAEVTGQDSTGDVWVALYNEQDLREGWDPAGSPPNADLVSTQVRHGPGRITSVTTYDSLDQGPGLNTFLLIQRMRFDKGPEVSLYVNTFQEQWQGQNYLWNEERQRQRQCDDLRVSVDYGADTVTASFPRRCVGKPAWLRYATHSWTTSGSKTETADDDFTYLDNGKDESSRVGTGGRNLSGPVAVG